MFRISLHLIIFACALATLPEAFAEEASCKTVVNYKDGSSAGQSAKVTLDSGKVVAIHVESFNASGEEGGAYFCTYDSAEQTPKPRFRVSGATTTVMTRDGAGHSVITVRKAGDRFVIDPSGISRDYCGFGAEWPRGITIEPGKKTCKVTRESIAEPGR